MLLIPIGHDRQVTKRLPIITILIISFNVLIFAYTATIGEQQYNRLMYAVKAALDFSESHPQIPLSADALNRIGRMPENEIRMIRYYLEQDQQTNIIQGVVNSLPLQTSSDEAFLKLEAARMSRELVEAYDGFSGYQYGFIPAYHKSSWLNYLTNMFMHGGFMHIFGNMLFLFLAGLAMEDAWGHTFYGIFYLSAGVVATLTHAFTAPDSKVYLVGASGAIAGLMGAFLVRFFKTKIKFFYFIIFRVGVFRAPAYVMLPLWIALELKDTFTSNPSDAGGVAFWAHIGGFFFGAVLCTFVYYSGLEKLIAPQNVKHAMSFGTGNAVNEARAHITENDYPEAIRKLTMRLEAVPNDVAAIQLLTEAYAHTNDRNAEVRTFHRLIRTHLQKGNAEDALIAYCALLDTYHPDEEIHRLGAREWLAICEYLQVQQRFEEAAGEYEKLARAYHQDAIAPQSLYHAALCRMQLSHYEYARELLRLAYDLSSSNPNLMMQITEQVAQIDNVLKGRNAA